jgi:hypothetical protein
VGCPLAAPWSLRDIPASHLRYLLRAALQTPSQRVTLAPLHNLVSRPPVFPRAGRRRVYGCRGTPPSARCCSHHLQRAVPRRRGRGSGVAKRSGARHSTTLTGGRATVEASKRPRVFYDFYVVMRCEVRLTSYRGSWPCARSGTRPRRCPWPGIRNLAASCDWRPSTLRFRHRRGGRSRSDVACASQSGRPLRGLLAACSSRARCLSASPNTGAMPCTHAHPARALAAAVYAAYEPPGRVRPQKQHDPPCRDSTNVCSLRR